MSDRPTIENPFNVEELTLLEQAVVALPMIYAEGVCIKIRKLRELVNATNLDSRQGEVLPAGPEVTVPGARQS